MFFLQILHPWRGFGNAESLRLVTSSPTLVTLFELDEVRPVDGERVTAIAHSQLIIVHGGELGAVKGYRGCHSRNIHGVANGDPIPDGGVRYER